VPFVSVPVFSRSAPERESRHIVEDSFERLPVEHVDSHFARKYLCRTCQVTGNRLTVFAREHGVSV